MMSLNDITVCRAPSYVQRVLSGVPSHARCQLRCKDDTVVGLGAPCTSHSQLLGVSVIMSLTLNQTEIFGIILYHGGVWRGIASPWNTFDTLKIVTKDGQHGQVWKRFDQGIA